MVSKGFTLLAHTVIFNKYIREWRRQATDHKKGKIQDLLSPNPLGAKEIGNNHRERGIYCGCKKRIWCTVLPSRRASEGYWPHQHNSPRYVDVDPRAVGTGTSHYSTYHIKHGGNESSGTYECDYERHAGTTHDTSDGANKKKGQIGNTTVGVAGETILTGVKPALPRNPSTRMMPNTRRDWAEVRKGANYG